MKAKNRLRAWKNRDGMTQIAAELDPEWGRIVFSQLNGQPTNCSAATTRTTPPTSPSPPSNGTNEHRLAEALVETCRRSDKQTAHPTSTHDRVVVTMTKQDLCGQDHDGPGPTDARRHPRPRLGDEDGDDDAASPCAWRHRPPRHRRVLSKPSLGQACSRPGRGHQLDALPSGSPRTSEGLPSSSTTPGWAMPRAVSSSAHASSVGPSGTAKARWSRGAVPTGSPAVSTTTTRLGRCRRAT